MCRDGAVPLWRDWPAGCHLGEEGEIKRMSEVRLRNRRILSARAAFQIPLITAPYLCLSFAPLRPFFPQRGPAFKFLKN